MKTKLVTQTTNLNVFIKSFQNGHTSRFCLADQNFKVSYFSPFCGPPLPLPREKSAKANDQRLYTSPCRLLTMSTVSRGTDC